MGAPLTIPLLPEATFIRFQARLGMAPRHPEKKECGPLPEVVSGHNNYYRWGPGQGDGPD